MTEDKFPQLPTPSEFQNIIQAFNTARSKLSDITENEEDKNNVAEFTKAADALVQNLTRIFNDARRKNTPSGQEKREIIIPIINALLYFNTKDARTVLNTVKTSTKNINSENNKIIKTETETEIEIEMAIKEGLISGKNGNVSDVFANESLKIQTPKIRSINPIIPQEKWDNLGFSNDLSRSITETGKKTDEVSKALHGTYKNLFDLRTAINDEHFESFKMALNIAGQGFYNAIQKYQNSTDKNTISLAKEQSVILIYINTGKKIITNIQEQLNGLDKLDEEDDYNNKKPKNNILSTTNTINSLTHKLNELTKGIKAHTASLGQSTAQIT